MKPYISVICPCYNGAVFIDSAIKSVISQPVKCIEMLIIDDGSTDNTQLVCERFVDDRVRYFKTDNLGAGHARNFGLKLATGTWVMYLDADDLFLLDSINPAFINTLYEFEKQEIDIIYTPCSYADFELKQWIRCENVEQIDIIPQYSFGTGIYNHNFLKKNDVRFYEYKEQDIESAFRYLAYDKSNKTVIDNNTKFYLQRDNGFSNSHTWDLRTVFEIKTMIYYDLIKNHSNSDKSHERLQAELLNSITTYFGLVQKHGFCDRNKYFLVCKITKEFLFLGEARKYFGTKKYLKEIIRFVLCRLVAQEKNADIPLKPKVYRSMISSDTAMERLKIVSSFLLNK